MSEKLQRLTIDKWDFAMEFETDSENDDFGYAYSSYLDRSTAEILRVFLSDESALDAADIPEEENRELRERTEANAERYLRIENLTLEDNTEMIEEFLNSNWTDNADLWQETYDAYNGSIGRWKKRVSQSTIRAFKEFEHQYVVVIAERFLRENGIEPVWKQYEASEDQRLIP